MVNLFVAFLNWLASFKKQQPAPAPAPVQTVPKEERISTATNQPAPKDIPPPVPKYLFDTPQNARHSVRVICDEEGLSVYNKNVITACIERESQFKNSAVGRNRNAAGKVTSTDWGICQINDTSGWHIGPGLAFPSVAYVVANPEKAVRYMIAMQKAGKLKLWVSYSSGAYLQFMPQ